MANPTPEYFRQAILAWLDTADEAELIEVLDLIQGQLTRRRLRAPRPPESPSPESDRQK